MSQSTKECTLARLLEMSVKGQDVINGYRAGQRACAKSPQLRAMRRTSGVFDTLTAPLHITLGQWRVS